MRINEPSRFVQGLPGFDCIRAVVERLHSDGVHQIIVYGLSRINPSQLIQYGSQLIPQRLIDPGVPLHHHFPAKQPPDDVILLGQASEFDRRLDLGILLRGDPEGYGLVPPTVVLVYIFC